LLSLADLNIYITSAIDWDRLQQARIQEFFPEGVQPVKKNSTFDLFLSTTRKAKKKKKNHTPILPNFSSNIIEPKIEAKNRILNRAYEQYRYFGESFKP
jgi:arginine decarboxylase-like protein